jgi:dTDP-4-amino-4,6-dideoxy-D-galactose acyltransferase
MRYIKTLAWESEFFIKKIGEVVFENNWDEMLVGDLNRFDLVQAKVNTEQIDRLDKLFDLGFRLAQSEISFKYEVNKCDQNANYRVASVEDISAVQEIAKDVFYYSRFRPPWFDEKDKAIFYSIWAEKAIRGIFDNVCLLVGEKDLLYGFVTLRDSNDGTARIGLLAQKTKEHVNHYGRKLVQAAISWCSDRQIVHLKVTTQLSNILAMRLYERTGAHVDSAAYWLYWSKRIE